MSGDIVAGMSQILPQMDGKDWSDCADTPADGSLCCGHMSNGTLLTLRPERPLWNWSQELFSFCKT